MVIKESTIDNKSASIKWCIVVSQIIVNKKIIIANNYVVVKWFVVD